MTAGVRSGKVQERIRSPRTCTEPSGVFDETSLDLGVEGGHALVVKGHFAADKHIEDDAEAPEVDFGSGVRFGVEELWGGKVEGAAERGELGVLGVEVREAKVDDFDVACFGDENVLDLEVYQNIRFGSQKCGKGRRAADVPLCTMLLAWQYSKALAICLANFRAARSRRRPWEMM